MCLLKKGRKEQLLKGILHGNCCIATVIFLRQVSVIQIQVQGRALGIQWDENSLKKEKIIEVDYFNYYV